MITNRVHRGGFSLIELLLAIFILGLGLISIAALFPAGIVMQQQAEDEFYGPVVAEHAMGVLRSRLRPEDFGSWWDFAQLQADELSADGGDGQALLTEMRATLANESFVQLGAWLRLTDWPWLRPSLVVNAPQGEGELDGAIDVFNHYGWSSANATVGEQTADADHPWRRFLGFAPDDFDQTALGVPFNPYDNVIEGEYVPPRVMVSSAERSWPPPDGSGNRPRYFWDCAFRKIGDRVQAAVFVYRATASTLTAPSFKPGATALDPSGAEVPAVPYRLPLERVGTVQQWMPGHGAADDPLPIYDMTQNVNDLGHAWMQSGQWVMDQMGTVHRVASGRDRNGSENDVLLTSPVPGPVVGAMLDTNDYAIGDIAYFTASTALPPYTFSFLRQPDFRHGVLRHPDAAGVIHPDPRSVDHLFYMPSELPGPGGVTYFIEPVFIGVEDL
ncbi:MAG: prepilin-type N-terminal cleavage/methylation domain-containing protein [Phycisphaerales bacterium]|nr:prepilin-type N-terminal cleavage/methylation domain-containing protein [Phycisphaerales bacterium]